MLTLFSYIVKSDTGLAPHASHGVCTLAYCKPRVRASALDGDYVVGISPAPNHRLVYAMRVTEKTPFAEYLARYPDRPRGDEEEETKCRWMLISADFVYWGGDGPPLPDELSGLVTTRAYKSMSNDNLIPAFEKWFDGLEKGRLGDPADVDEPKRRKRGLARRAG